MFLSLSFIAGCAHQVQEKPEEPSAVEEPVSEDNEQDTIEYINKIDSSKDWVYISESAEIEVPDYAVEDLLTMEYTDGNDFENWYSEISTTKPELDKFVINIDTPEWKTVNEQIAAAYEEKTQTPLTLGIQYLSQSFFVSDDILSVVIKEGSFLPRSDQKGNIYVFNVDLHTEEIIDNQKLLEYFQLSVDEYKDLLFKHYQDVQRTHSCEEENSIGCYYIAENIDNEALIVIDNQLYKIDQSFDGLRRIHRLMMMD